MTSIPAIEAVAERLLEAERVLFITGAGISADSGLPTYRGIGGLYNDRHTDEGLPIEVALSAEVMRKTPAITWKYLAQIEAACRAAQPNAAHEAIARLQQHRQVTVLTQNIDGFHRRAGSHDLIEIHGNLFDLYCGQCGHEAHVPDYSGLDKLPPPCPECGHFLRPRVVLFNEMLPEAALGRLYETMERGYDLVFSVGTTSVFPYIAEPFRIARRVGALAVEINPADTEVSHYADIRWRCGAAEALTALMAQLT